MKKKLIEKIKQRLIDLERYSYFDILALCDKVLPNMSRRKLRKFWREICE